MCTSAGLSDETIVRFGLGFAPEGWDNLTKAMRQKGYTGEELKPAVVVKYQVGESYQMLEKGKTPEVEPEPEEEELN